MDELRQIVVREISVDNLTIYTRKPIVFEVDCGGCRATALLPSGLVVVHSDLPEQLPEYIHARLARDYEAADKFHRLFW